MRIFRNADLRRNDRVGDASHSAGATCTSEPKRVLQLRRRSIEAGRIAPVEIPKPSAVQYEKEIVARSQNPPKPALEAQDASLVVVLLEVLPRDVRREVVVRSRGENLRVELPPGKRNVVAIESDRQRQVAARLQCDTEPRLLPRTVVEA